MIKNLKLFDIILVRVMPNCVIVNISLSDFCFCSNCDLVISNFRLDNILNISYIYIYNNVKLNWKWKIKVSQEYDTARLPRAHFDLIAKTALHRFMHFLQYFERRGNFQRDDTFIRATRTSSNSQGTWAREQLILSRNRPAREAYERNIQEAISPRCLYRC